MQGHRVVIIGGGFGGLCVAQRLKRAPVEIALIDRRNFHLFQPLLYQVATGGLSVANIAVPLRSILKRQANTRVLMAAAEDVDLDGRRVVFADGCLEYDTLVIAAGSENHYFGNDVWESVAPGLKTIEDAMEIRRRVFAAFEAAERASDIEEARRWLTFVVVGGGPTGVELAGALAEIARDTLAREFRSINPAEAHIVLLEGADRILASYPGQLPEKARRQLEQLDVVVRTGAVVSHIEVNCVTITTGGREEHIPARTVLWGAGVKASGLSQQVASSAGIELDRSGRIPVEADLTVPGYPSVFVIGDMAACADETGALLPCVAPAAVQQGKYVARAICRRLRNRTVKPFRYRHYGSMATIGRHRAVAVLGSLKISGYLAWFAWLFVHVANLIEFRARLFVLLEWAWNYFTWNRGARLITSSHLAPTRKRAGVQTGTEERAANNSQSTTASPGTS